MRIRTIVAAILTLASLPAVPARGQIVFDQPGSFAVKFNYGSWALDPAAGPDEELAQTSLGLSGFVPIRENFEARYQILTASNNLETGGAADNMSGLGDLRLQLAHSFAKDRALLSAGFNLPTGKARARSRRRFLEPCSWPQDTQRPTHAEMHNYSPL